MSGIFAQYGHALFSGSATLTNSTTSALLYSASANIWPDLYQVAISTNDTTIQQVTITDGTTTLIYFVGGSASNPPVVDQASIPVRFVKGATITATAGAVTAGKSIAVNIRGLTASDGASVFSILSLPGLKAAWSAGTGFSVDGSNNVQSLADYSGNGVNYSQVTSTARPPYTAVDANWGVGTSLPSVAIASGKSILATLLVAQPLTRILVAYNLTSPAVGSQMCGGNTNRVDLGKNSGGWYMYAGNVINVTGGANDTSPHVFAFVANGVNSKLYVDSSTSPTTGNAGTDSLQDPIISNFPCTGGYGEEVICAGALSASQISQVFALFGSKYKKSWS